ncbi:MAG: acyl-CoA synthetase [Burkholderiaceae bacterium]
MAEPSHARPEWTRREERSHDAALRLMAWLSLHLGRRVSRWVLHGIAAYFVLFAPQARRASRQYLSRALGRPAGWRDVYVHVLSFASTVHDRVYLLNDRFDLFDIRTSGQELVQAFQAQGQGVIMIGAHLGSFEALRAVGRHVGGARVAMMMYEDNARKINRALKAINPAAVQDIIALGQPGSMLSARDRLDEGCLVGMLADRRLGTDPVAMQDFLGAAAPFPDGPFRVAAMLRRPVVFMAGLYLGGNRYHIHFEPLADFSNIGPAQRAAAVADAQRAYAERLSRFCRIAPYNWFNFFDFWRAS